MYYIFISNLKNICLYTEHRLLYKVRLEDVYLSTETSDNRGDRKKRRGSRKSRIGRGGITQTKTKQERENATTLIKS